MLSKFLQMTNASQYLSMTGCGLVIGIYSLIGHWDLVIDHFHHPNPTTGSCAGVCFSNCLAFFENSWFHTRQME